MVKVNYKHILGLFLGYLDRESPFDLKHPFTIIPNYAYLDPYELP